MLSTKLLTVVGGSAACVPYSKIDGVVRNGEWFLHPADGVIAWTVRELHSSGSADMKFRGQDTSNLWIARTTNVGAMQLRHNNGGSTSTISSTASGTVEDGDRVQVSFIGPIITFYVNGVQVLQYTEATALQTATEGAFSTGDGAFEDLQTWDYNCLSSALEDIPQYFSVASSQLLWSGSTADDDWVGRPVLLDRGDGIWLVGYRQAAEHAADVDAVCHLRFSDDEGVTWSDADTYIGGGAITGTPFGPHSTNSLGTILLIPAPNGDILIHGAEHDASHRTAGTYQYRSTDGGLTWTDEGLIASDGEIHGGNDWDTVGSDIYATFWRDEDNDGPPLAAELYKSTNNGTTWSKVSVIVSSAIRGDEASIQHTGGTNLLSIIRDNGTAEDKSYVARSSDLGLTWGALEDYAAIFGTIHRPRTRKIGDRIYLVGRCRVWPQVGIGHLSSGTTRSYPSIWYSDDNGITWTRRFDVEPESFTDAAYSDILPRDDGTLYMLTYLGTSSATNASVYEYVLNVLT